jgi:hypothetical protein
VELLCPECLAPLESADGQTARCTTHGGEYQILFARQPFAAPAMAAMPPVILGEGAVCVQHPSVPALLTCDNCEAPMCATCDFPQATGLHLCPNCATAQAYAPPVMTTAAQAIPEGVHCPQHPNSRAVAKCKVCGGFMCNTCTFDLPGGIKLCPTCATATPKIRPKRKKLLIASYVLAVWCTIMMAGLFGGMFRGFANDEESRKLFGLVLMLLLPLPSLVGVALAVSSMERRVPNTIAMWIATAWNGIILAGFVLLIIVGIAKGGE